MLPKLRLEFIWWLSSMMSSPVAIILSLNLALTLPGSKAVHDTYSVEFSDSSLEFEYPPKQCFDTKAQNFTQPSIVFPNEFRKVKIIMIGKQRQNLSNKRPGNRVRVPDGQPDRPSSTSSAASAYQQRSEAVSFAALSDLPTGMANLLRPEREVEFQVASEEVDRLDAELRDATARERRVKRDRAVLEIRLRQELDQMEAASSSQRARTTEAGDNTAKYLALMDGDIRQHRSELLDLPQPVFQTECPTFDEPVQFDESKDDGAASDDDGQRVNHHHHLHSRGKRHRNAEQNASESAVTSAAKVALTNGKDFVQRNILLAASRANASVPMTPDERARLDDLLREDSRSNSESEVQVEADFELSRLRSTEAKQLAEIEAKLKAMDGSDGSPSGVLHSTAPGDPNLAAIKEHRLMERRLDRIEEKLRKHPC